MEPHIKAPTILRLIITLGSKFCKVHQNIFIGSFLEYFYLVFLLCKNTFMNDWNEIYSYNDLKYDTYKIIETFLLLILMGSKNNNLMIAIRTRSFLSWLVHPKRFSPHNFRYRNNMDWDVITWPNAKHGLEKLLTSI